MFVIDAICRGLMKLMTSRLWRGVLRPAFLGIGMFVAETPSQTGSAMPSAEADSRAVSGEEESHTSDTS